MSPRGSTGTLVLLGGGEWRNPDLDRELVAASGAKEVVVLPTAAAFEHPDRVVQAATEYFKALDAEVTPLMVLHRGEAQDEANATVARDSKFLYLSDGSPLHLRSVLKDSALFEAMVAAYNGGAVLAASGAAATLLCDPMVDPRGGAYTVGLGIVTNLAVFPYHGSVASHLRERSIDLLPATATLAGIDEGTALIREPSGNWRVAGSGRVTLYRGSDVTTYDAGATVVIA